MKQRLAFIGLGVMGYPMAGHLATAGHNVTVYNRSSAKSSRWIGKYAGTVADSPADAAHRADYIFCCVGDDDDLTNVLAGHHGVFDALRRNAVIVDHTTVSAQLAKRFAAQCVERDAWFIDAPVSGGEAGAVNGVLTVMAGGSRQAYERVEPFIGCYARYQRLLGGAGAGQTAKMVNQVCIAGLVQALAEGLNFAQKAGLDTAAVVDVISRGAAQSWQMDNRSETMLAGEYGFGFAVDWMRKDLGIALAEARRHGAALPVTALVDQFYAQLQAAGGGRWDTSSLLALLARLPAGGGISDSEGTITD